MPKTTNYNLDKILKKEHEGKWVAISADYTKVLGYSDNLQKLGIEIKDSEAIYLKAMIADTQYSFSV